MTDVNLRVQSVLMLVLLCSSCIRTEVINEVVPVSTRTKQQDTTFVTLPADTSRVPITFDPSVEDWEATDVELDI